MTVLLAFLINIIIIIIARLFSEKSDNKVKLIQNQTTATYQHFKKNVQMVLVLSLDNDNSAGLSDGRNTVDITSKIGLALACSVVSSNYSNLGVYKIHSTYGDAELPFLL